MHRRRSSLGMDILVWYRRRSDMRPMKIMITPEHDFVYMLTLINALCVEQFSCSFDGKAIEWELKTREKFELQWFEPFRVRNDNYASICLQCCIMTTMGANVVLYLERFQEGRLLRPDRLLRKSSAKNKYPRKIFMGCMNNFNNYEPR